VQAGDVVAAAAALGREHRVEGVVVRGDQRGRALGYPTANVEPLPWSAVPADGVYAGRVVRAREVLPAAISIGTNPTFAGREQRVEAFVIDAEPGLDLYGEHVGVCFTARLRGTERFPDPAALVAQMDDDVARTREALAGHPLG
jgi:riboflavin kinase/FMN adenylyltransferase